MNRPFIFSVMNINIKTIWGGGTNRFLFQNYIQEVKTERREMSPAADFKEGNKLLQQSEGRN